MPMTQSLPFRMLSLPLPAGVAPDWAAPLAHKAMRRAVKRARDLRMVLAPWADHLWFASAVVIGLALASWLAVALGLHLDPPAPTLIVL
jgi:hypothetical protein